MPASSRAMSLENATTEAAAGLEVRVVESPAAFAALEAEWNALVRATRDEIFYRHEFFRVWLDNFAPRARLRVLAARDERGRLVAVLPLMVELSLLDGMPVRKLRGIANDHSCRFDLIAADPRRAATAFLAYLKADRGWDVLLLPDVPAEGNAWHLYSLAQARGCPAGNWVSLRSPYVPLPASFEALQQQLQSKFKANLRRRRRKLEEQGEVTFERVSAREDLDRKLSEGYALEQSGWKGREGTAISQDAPTRGFYTALAHQAADHGRLSLYFLRVDGKPVAFQYAITYAGRYSLLKPAYDEEQKECSPGQLLMEQVLRDCIDRGLSEFDFLGPHMVWKEDWTDRVREHTWLYVFAPSHYGRMLRGYRFGLLPRLKAKVKQWQHRS